MGARRQVAVKHCKDLIVKYMVGDATQDEWASAEAHLKKCPKCNDFWLFVTKFNLILGDIRYKRTKGKQAAPAKPEPLAEVGSESKKGPHR